MERSRLRRAVCFLTAAVAMIGGAAPARAQGKQAGMPPAQAQRIQAWARSTAVFAATYGFAIVAMYNLLNTVAVGRGAKAPPGTICKFDQIAAPEIAAQTGCVTPNVDVVYGFGSCDLGQEPVIVTALDCDGRYYMIEIVDMWDNAFAYAAGKEVGYRVGKYAVVGPGRKGELPPGIKRFDSATRWVEMQPCVRVKDQADLPGAVKVMNAITVQGL